jgi:hypothetical protein
VRSRERGAALILVLGAVAILTVVAVELASRASADSLRAARSIRDAAFRRLVDSAGETARGLLVERKPQDFDYAGDAWNGERSLTLGRDETASFRVEDESGKINLALAAKDPEGVRARVARCFEYLRRRKPGDAKALKDVEAKVLRRIADPEALVTLDGLREAGLTIDEVFGPDGFARFFTCFGDGPVNVNTAPPAVLFSLGEDFDEALVDRIVAWRGTPKSPRAFESVKDLALVDGVVVRVPENGAFRVVKDLVASHGRFLGIASSAFSVRVEARVGTATRLAWVFLKPDGSRLACEEVRP